jgi:hypothetical protein
VGALEFSTFASLALMDFFLTIHMKKINKLIALSVLLGTISTSLISQPSQSDKEKTYEKLYSSLASQVNTKRIQKGVYYLSKDPLTRRVMNDTLPGHKLSMLEEADNWIMKQLSSKGYKPETDNTQVHAFGPKPCNIISIML